MSLKAAAIETCFRTLAHGEQITLAEKLKQIAEGITMRNVREFRNMHSICDRNELELLFRLYKTNVVSYDTFSAIVATYHAIKPRIVGATYKVANELQFSTTNAKWLVCDPRLHIVACCEDIIIWALSYGCSEITVDGKNIFEFCFYSHVYTTYESHTGVIRTRCQDNC